MDQSKGYGVNFTDNYQYEYPETGKAIKRISKLPKNKYLFLYIKNKIYHFYLQFSKSTKVAYPSTVMLELANKCNLSCTTCAREYEYGKQMDQGIITEEQAKKSLMNFVPVWIPSD